MLTQTQIQNFIVKAKAAGFTPQQIQQEIVRKQNETQQTQQPQPQPQVQQPVQQPQAPVQQPTAQPNPQPQKSFAQNFFEGLVAPAKKYATFVGEAAGQAVRSGVQAITGERKNLFKKVESGEASDEDLKRLKELTDPIFMKQEDFSKLGTPGGIAKETVKATAGGASYLVPGGAATKALVGSGLATLSTTDKQDIEGMAADFGIGAATGLLFHGAFSLAGKGLSKATNPIFSKITAKLSNVADDMELGTYVKSMGIKPINKFGGKGLLNNMRLLGFKPGEATSIIEQADEVLAKNSKTVGAIAEEMSGQGKKINIAKWVAGLEKDVANTKLPSDKKLKDAVVQEIKSVVGDNLEDVDPSDFYVLKQALGAKGRWNSNADPDSLIKAETFRDAYVSANEVFDKALKDNGFDQFRSINEALHTAINAKAWAEHADNIAPNINSIGLLDTISGLAGAGIAGIPGAVVGIGVRKALNSTTARTAVAKGLKKGLTLAEGEMGAKAKSALNDIVTKALAQATRDEVSKPAEDMTVDPTLDTNAPTVETPTSPLNTPPEGDLGTEQPDVFGGMSKQDLLRKAASMGATNADLKEISERYDMLSGGTGAVTDETRTVANSLRTEYFQRTKENNYLEAVNNFGKVKKAPDTAAGDVSIIFAYMKMLDPGSVVREGEFATAENTAGIPDRIRNAYNKAIKGKRLGDTQRAEFTTAAEQVYSQYKSEQDNIDKLYADLAGQYGINPSLVGIGTFGGGIK